MVTIVNADCVQWAKEYAASGGELFHALLTDCPYEMGMMQKKWDNSGVAFNPETWRALATCLHPGAFLFVMAGTINDDLISVAMREAGLVKHHKAVLYWQNGQSFPKSQRIDTQIDRAAGAVREVEWYDRYHDGGTRQNLGERGVLFESRGKNGNERSLPATPLAATWQGHRYGGQALKNCAETILIFRKPYAGKPVDSITSTGAGALNIELARIGTNGGGTHCDNRDVNGKCLGHNNSGQCTSGETVHGESYTAGRWPATSLLLHHPICRRLEGERVVKSSVGWSEKDRDVQFEAPFSGGWNGRGSAPMSYADPTGHERIARYACAQQCSTCGATWAAEDLEQCPHCGGKAEWECVVRVLDGQSGVSNSPHLTRNSVVTVQPGGNGKTMGTGWSTREVQGYADTGGASRFFFQADYTLEAEERIDSAAPFWYSAKASRAERDAGLEEMPLVTKPSGGHGNKELDAISVALGSNRSFRNPHPTVKPLKLTEYLARLLLPPVEYAPRRILVPFGGVGSEAIGAMLAGWEDVVAVELEAEYCEIAQARVRYWESKREARLINV